MKSSAIFDFGGVLIDWNPRHLYRKVFDDDETMEDFLANICNDDWQEQQNERRGWAEAIEERVTRFPQHRTLIEMYRNRWPEMLGGAYHDTVDVLGELRLNGTKLYGLTNWSAEMFPHARQRFDFVDWFEGIVVSGEVGVRKPSPEIYLHLFERYRIDPRDAVFVDDNRANVQAGVSLGLQSHHFTSAGKLRAFLKTAGLL